MLQGLLPYNKEAAEYFKGVNWKCLNTRYKNDYAAALNEVIRQKGLDSSERAEELSKITLSVQNVYNRLQMLDIKVARLRKKPKQA